MGKANKNDGKRSIYSHKMGKAIKFGQAWVDHYIQFGCNPDFRTLYMEHVAQDGTVDKDDVSDEGELDDDCKVIDARNSAYTFIRRYEIKEWVDEQKIKELANRSSLVKADYLGILNAIIMNPESSNADRLKALQQVTKMLGIEGASKIEQAGGFSLRMDYKQGEE
jgi:hypothetical protein